MALQNSDILPLFRITDSTNRKITVADFATYATTEAGVPKPGIDGSFVIVENAKGEITFSEIVDGGVY
jgi:hypothetical protein